MSIILTPPLESFKYSYQIAEHAQASVALCHSQGIDRSSMSNLAYVEFLIDEAAHTGEGHAQNIAEARAAFDVISENVKLTSIGQSMAEKLMHEEFFITAHKAMLAAVATGICRMSKSGKTAIFLSPILNRVDLSGYYPHAVYQLRVAGISC